MATTTNNDIEIYYEALGNPDDPTVLLVSGLGTQSIGYDDEFCEEFLGLGLQVLRFDNRDVGLSTHVRPAGPAGGGAGDFGEALGAAIAGDEIQSDYRLTDMAADAIAVLDAANVESAHIWGASMGGMIAQTIVIEHPSRSRSLTSVMSTTGEAEYGIPDPDCVAGLMSIMEPSETREARIESGVELQRLIGTKRGWDEERVRTRTTLAVDRAYDPGGVSRQMMAILASGSRADGLAALRLPTSVMHGDKDPLVNPSGGVRTAELIPNSELRTMDGMGHDLPPEYWGEMVTAFKELL